jgi:hypothetical protein
LEIDMEFRMSKQTTGNEQGAARSGISRRGFVGGALGLAAAAALTKPNVALGLEPMRDAYRGIPLRIKASFSPPEISTGNVFHIVGDLLYVGNTRGGQVTIVDISTPVQPKVVATATWPGMAGAASVTVRGSLMVVTDAVSSSVGTFDVSDPANPQLLGVITSASELAGAWFVDVQGNYAYIGCRGSNPNGAFEDGAFTVVDISDPTNLQLAAVVQDEFTPEFRHVQVRGKYAYLADQHRAGDFTGQGSLQIFDVSNPTRPIRVSRLATPELLDARKVMLAGSVAIVCGRDVPDARIVSVDVRDPSNPVQLDAAGAANTNFTHGLDIVGRYCYMASTVDGSVSAWDIQDPSNLTLADIIVAPELDDCSEVAAHRQHLFAWSRGNQAVVVLG